jgi:preprotein translocase subunit SecG
VSSIIVAIHIVVCIALILIVLLQTGKGADMGAAFGGSSQTVFGSYGASSFLSKVTVAAATIFLLTSLLLAVLFGKGVTSSIMKGVSQPQAPITQGAQAPAPAPTAPAPAPAGDQAEP